MTAPNLKKIFSNKKIIKIFHYGRADMAHIKYYLKTETTKYFRYQNSFKTCKILFRQSLFEDFDKRIY